MIVPRCKKTLKDNEPNSVTNYLSILGEYEIMHRLMSMIVDRISGLVVLVWKLFRRVCMAIVKLRFKKCGKHVIINPFDSFSYSTISLGNHVFIGKGAVLMASDSSISIGNKVMFGPKVTIMGGDHNASEIGQYMIDVKSKLSGDDLPVVVEDDVWVGTGAIILKGVNIGCGSIIAAGSVVNKSIPEYSIAAGVPARVVKPRFSVEKLAEHKRLLEAGK